MTYFTYAVTQCKKLWKLSPFEALKVCPCHSDICVCNTIVPRVLYELPQIKLQDHTLDQSHADTHHTPRQPTHIVSSSVENGCVKRANTFQAADVAVRLCELYMYFVSLFIYHIMMFKQFHVSVCAEEKASHSIFLIRLTTILYIFRVVPIVLQNYVCHASTMFVCGSQNGMYAHS